MKQSSKKRKWPGSLILSSAVLLVSVLVSFSKYMDIERQENIHNL